MAVWEYTVRGEVKGRFNKTLESMRITGTVEAANKNAAEYAARTEAITIGTNSRKDAVGFKVNEVTVF